MRAWTRWVVLSAGRHPMSWLVAAALVVATGGSAPAAAAPGTTAAEQTLGILTPAEWAEVALSRCRADVERTRRDDEALAARLAAEPTSRERAGFLVREEEARTVARTKARRGRVAQLIALLFGLNRKITLNGSRRAESLEQLLNALFERSDVCGIEAVEATTLLGVFGIPLDAEAAANLGADRHYDVVEARFRGLLDRGESLEQAYAAMRPPTPRPIDRYVEAVTRAAVTLPEAPAADGTAVDGSGGRRIRQFVAFLPYAAEPARIHFYLHGKVDAIEGAFGAVLPDGVDEHLFEMAQARLYKTVPLMQDLRGQPPDAVLARLQPILDEWFAGTALPALGFALRRDPHAATWFYVQSGGVVEPGPVSRHSRVVARAPAFALADLRGLSLDVALGRVEDRRIPARFRQAFAELETAFTEVTLSPDDVLQRLTRRDAPPALAARVRTLLDGEASRRVSTLDAFSRLIRDASVIRGRLDREALAAAMDVLSAAKADAVRARLHAVLEAMPAPDPRLAGYLETATSLLLELERRQATEKAFQQGTSGAAVGWLISRFFMGGQVPVALWVPQGVTGPEFSELVDELTPKNARSGNDYRGRAVADIDVVHDGREYHEALITVVDSARRFLNISSFDWKTDTGGRDLAYRLMAKKLGIDGAAYARFLAAFEGGLPMDPANPAVVAFYDIPTTRMKDLLVWHFFMTSTQADVVAARDAARAAGASLECATVMTCGDLTALAERTATNPEEGQTGGDGQAWHALQAIDGLFAERPPALDDVRPRRALRDYCEDADALRRFVRRAGLRRDDRPDQPFPITIVADAKQNLFNIRWGERSQQFPYVMTEPIRDIYFMLLEFDIRVVLWKGLVEFPWNAGPVPWPGRRVLGRIPFPFVPWPWISAVPGFGWAGATTSLGLQWLLASDIRIWWGSVNHTKSWSNESVALESGMGMGSKYFNEFDTHKTWHDLGVLVRGGTVGDVNDHFVEVFNEARVNNAGLPASRGVRVPRLNYEDFRSTDHTAAALDQPRAWLLTTHPERGDANYRGVYVAALAAARKNIYIENSFFSDPLVANLLIRKARELRGQVNCEGLGRHACAAARRDAVTIHLILPDSSDKPIVDAVGAADFHEMLHLGIKVHRWNPQQGWSASRMLHSKVWLIDYEEGRGGLAYLGAANATQRSHLADNEAGVLSNAPDFARQVYERVFVPDLENGSRRQSGEHFHFVRSSNVVIRGSRWLRRFLVELLWLI